MVPSKGLSGAQMPIANKAAAGRAQATQGVSLQNQLKAQGAAPTTPATVQQTAAGFETAQNTAALQGQAAEAGREATAASRGFQQDQLQTAEDNLARDREVEQTRREAEQRIASAGRDVAEQLLNKELAFNEQTRQAEFANERQLADYIASNSRDEQDFLQRSQDMVQASQEEVRALEWANQQMITAMKNDFQGTEAEKDRDAQKRIMQAQADLQRKIASEKKKSAALSKTLGAAKIVAGAAIGFFVPGGQAVGASMAVSGASEVAGS